VPVSIAIQNCLTNSNCPQTLLWRFFVRSRIPRSRGRSRVSIRHSWGTPRTRQARHLVYARDLRSFTSPPANCWVLRYGSPSKSFVAQWEPSPKTGGLSP